MPRAGRRRWTVMTRRRRPRSRPTNPGRVRRFAPWLLGGAAVMGVAWLATRDVSILITIPVIVAGLVWIGWVVVQLATSLTEPRSSDEMDEGATFPADSPWRMTSNPSHVIYRARAGGQRTGGEPPKPGDAK
jgi:hypothetical protein